MKLRSNLFELLWLAAAVITFVIVALYITSENRRVPILVAKQPLHAGNYVQASDLEVRSVHPDNVTANVMQPAQEGDLVGAYILDDVSAGEFLTKRDFARSKDGQPLFSNRITSTIPSPDLRLVSWDIRDDKFLADRAKIGDYMDIVLSINNPTTKEEVTKTILQRVKILDLTPTDVVFMVNPQQAEELFFARQSGHVDFSLSPPDAIEYHTTGVTFDILRTRYLDKGVVLNDNSAALLVERLDLQRTQNGVTVRVAFTNQTGDIKSVKAIPTLQLQQDNGKAFAAPSNLDNTLVNLLTDMPPNETRSVEIPLPVTDNGHGWSLVFQAPEFGSNPVRVPLE